MPPSFIHADPVITKLLENMPVEIRGSFTSEQLLALKVALGRRPWTTHPVDLRWTLKWWQWHYYFVFLAGRNRRLLTDREQAIRWFVMASALAIFLSFCALLGILVLYLIKSALGIDLIPGYSLGIWDWFKTEVWPWLVM